MLRISRDQATNGSVNIRLEGVITGPWVEETKRVCGAAAAGGHKLRLDLAGISFVDREGVKLLARLQKTNAVLENCSAFLEAQLRSVQN
jgi:ABC-type transporter Mla MlaB component